MVKYFTREISAEQAAKILNRLLLESRVTRINLELRIVTSDTCPYRESLYISDGKYKYAVPSEIFNDPDIWEQGVLPVWWRRPEYWQELACSDIERSVFSKTYEGKIPRKERENIFNSMGLHEPDEINYMQLHKEILSDAPELGGWVVLDDLDDIIKDESVKLWDSKYSTNLRERIEYVLRKAFKVAADRMDRELSSCISRRMS